MPQQWLYVWMLVAVGLMLVQFLVTPGYGRHTSAAWGPTLPNQLAWVLMESVALGAFWFVWWWQAPHNLTGFFGTTAQLAALLYSVHYVHRGLIYPWRTRTQGKRMPVVIMLAAIAFNLINGALLGGSLASQAVVSRDAAAWPLHSVLGGLLFVGGAVVNIRADNTLLALRQGQDRGYHIPQGGLYRYISCPNFLGEILQWFGFALLCWNLPALAFAVWTASNLVPRALAHHRWYQTQFADYPSNRRALIPGVL